MTSIVKQQKPKTFTYSMLSVAPRMQSFTLQSQSSLTPVAASLLSTIYSPMRSYNSQTSNTKLRALNLVQLALGAFTQKVTTLLAQTSTPRKIKQTLRSGIGLLVFAYKRHPCRHLAFYQSQKKSLIAALITRAPCFVFQKPHQLAIELQYGRSIGSRA